MISVQEKYTELTQREHILEKPNIYIGSIDNEEANVWIFENGCLIKKNITYNSGFYKIIDEVISNSSDHSIKDKTCTEIKININKDTGEIIIYNNGNDGIEIELYNKTKNLYVPELIFSHLLSSSNYNKKQKRITNGTNGLGVKLCNVYSKIFNVEIVDARKKLKYNQTFKNNLTEIEKPIIIDSKKESYTKVSFLPDYNYFKFKLDDDFINLLKKAAYDLSFCTRKNVNIYFNDELINVKNFSDYIHLYFPTILSSNIVTCELNEKWNIAFCYTPNTCFQQVSFVNNNLTLNGGNHVNYILNNITKQLINKIKIKHKDLTIRPSYIQDNMTLFIKCYIDDPTYTSQCKTELKNVINSKFCVIEEEFINIIYKTDIVEDAIQFAKIKQTAELKKTDGKKGKRVDVEKYREAKWSRIPSKANQCRLIITEGDSAKTFALYGIEVIGSEKYGVYPIRGKMLNVRDASIKQIMLNKEISDIKSIIGIKQGVDYSIEKNRKELKYGGILILTDQDLDGAHIKGLIINFIHTFWRELAMIEGFFQTIRTPILKSYKKSDKNMKNPLIFYSQTKYNEWTKKIGPDINNWIIKYYKGLGTSTEQEAKECFSGFDEKILYFKWEDILIEGIDMESKLNIESETITENNSTEIVKKIRKSKKEKKVLTYKPTISDQAINLAFSKDKIENRKEWLLNYDRNIIYEPSDQRIPYSEFINKELIHFSNYDNIRSIPSICDGLKPSQRKALFATIEKRIDKKSKEIKVSNLASIVSDRTNYLHGETSLVGTIVKMAQNFTGSNNINIFTPDGNFGSKRAGGEDAAAARYIQTYLEKLTLYIFRQEDNGILKYNVEEGKEIEPELYYPIIPMVLINGSCGIGTGFSTNIPLFNPLDIMDNLIKMIENKDNELIKLTPWYRDYKGTITQKDCDTYISTGIYTINNRCRENIIKISELPIETWTENYTNFLKGKDKKGKVKDKKGKDKKNKDDEEYFIKDVEDYSPNNSVDITIEFYDGVLQDLIKNNELESKLKLTSIIKTSNMQLYNSENIIHKYETIEDILIEFYNTRLIKYKERKEYYVKILKNELNILKYKIKFIKDYIDKIIIIEKKKKNDIIQKLIELKYPRLSTNINAIDPKVNIELDDDNDDNIKSDDSKKVVFKTYNYITDIKLFSLSYEKIHELQNLIKSKKEELEIYINTSIKDIWKKELFTLREKYIEWDDELIKLKNKNDAKDKNIKSKKNK
jgi:DNA topoisomerase-2